MALVAHFEPRPWTTTSTPSSAGLYFSAFSTRFDTARSSSCGRANTVLSVPSSTTSTARPLRRPPCGDSNGRSRSTAPLPALHGWPNGPSPAPPARTRGGSAPRPRAAHLRRRAWYSPGSSSSARRGSSALVLRLVSGVRSSWLASTDELLLLASRLTASASTIVVKLRARLPISAAPLDRDRRGEVLGARDPLGGVAQLVDRLHDAARDAASRGASPPPTPDEADDDQPQCAAKRAHRRPRRDCGRTGRRHHHGRDGDDSVVAALETDGLDVGLAAFTRERGVVGIDRDRRAAFDARGHGAVGADALRGGGGLEHPRRRAALRSLEITFSLDGCASRLRVVRRSRGGRRPARLRRAVVATAHVGGLSSLALRASIRRCRRAVDPTSRCRPRPRRTRTRGRRSAPRPAAIRQRRLIVSRGAEDVADAAHGVHEAGLAPGFGLGPEVPDVHVERAELVSKSKPQIRS